jgi:hypothetical protein
MSVTVPIMHAPHTAQKGAVLLFSLIVLLLLTVIGVAAMQDHGCPLPRETGCGPKAYSIRGSGDDYDAAFGIHGSMCPKCGPEDYLH